MKEYILEIDKESFIFSISLKRAVVKIEMSEDERLDFHRRYALKEDLYVVMTHESRKLVFKIEDLVSLFHKDLILVKIIRIEL